MTSNNYRPKLSQSFKDRADNACFFEAWVATKLARSGLYCTHLPMHLGEYQDPSKGTSHDLDVSLVPDGTIINVEVKSRKVCFNTPADYPYPTVNVCSENFFKKNWGQSDGAFRDFIIVSTITGECLWIPAGTPLRPVDTVDRERGEKLRLMVCEKSSLCTLDDFIENVRNQLC